MPTFVRVRVLLACLPVAAGACGLNAAGLGFAGDGGSELPPWEADGVVDADAGPEADADAAADVAPEADADAGLDVEADAGPEADADAGLDVEADAGPEAEAEEEADVGAEDAGEAEVPPVCDPGGLDDTCASDVVRRCRPDGGGFDEIWCPFGCSGSGTAARCFELDVPNVDDDSLLWAGTALFSAPAARVVLFETDTGAIRAWDAVGAELPRVRAAGEGDIGGVGFAVESQGGGAPDLGIWSFGEFRVPAGLDVIGRGSRAMVVLSAGEVRIEGRVLVGGSAAVLAGATWVGHDEAGPGGSSGGAAENRGGGGGSGGAVLLVGPRIDIMGGVAANGGGGGAGAYSTSAGGQNGQNGQLATTAAAGGAGSGEGTSGGNGSEFDTLAGGNGQSDSNDDDSGGGGGGAGRIRLDGLVIGVGGFLSPDEAHSGTPRGTLALY